MSQKVYILDTSVIVHDPDSLRGFDDNVVVVPHPVIRELDGLKVNDNGRGHAARAATRFLRSLLHRHGSLGKGVPLDNGGLLFVERGMVPPRRLPVKRLPETIDNFIVGTAKLWQDQELKKPKAEQRLVILVTKDSNLAITADACGLSVQDYLRDRAVKSVSDLPTGHLQVPLVGDRRTLGKFIDDGEVPMSHLRSSLPEHLPMNTCVSLGIDGGRAIHGIYEKDRLRIIPHQKKKSGQGGLNIRQAFANFLIRSPGIYTVALNGQAGTGKTFVALMAGLQMLKESGGESEFHQIVVYRPNIQIGKDLGFLPGDLSEKFAPWMMPIIDNLQMIEEYFGDESWWRHLGCSSEDLITRERVVVSPINFIRGRSIAHSLVIIDECQNLTPHEIKTVVSRAGSGTRFVLTGDLHQIDNPFLDTLSNGLAHVIQRFHGHSRFGHILLTEGERSELAEMAASLL